MVSHDAGESRGGQARVVSHGQAGTGYVSWAGAGSQARVVSLQEAGTGRPGYTRDPMRLNPRPATPGPVTPLPDPCTLPVQATSYIVAAWEAFADKLHKPMAEVACQWEDIHMHNAVITGTYVRVWWWGGGGRGGEHADIGAEVEAKVCYWHECRGWGGGGRDMQLGPPRV